MEALRPSCDGLCSLPQVDKDEGTKSHCRAQQPGRRGPRPQTHGRTKQDAKARPQKTFLRAMPARLSASVILCHGRLQAGPAGLSGCRSWVGAPGTHRAEAKDGPARRPPQSSGPGTPHREARAGPGGQLPDAESAPRTLGRSVVAQAGGIAGERGTRGPRRPRTRVYARGSRHDASCEVRSPKRRTAGGEGAPASRRGARTATRPRDEKPSPRVGTASAPRL